jgi:hypothetical protein
VGVAQEEPASPPRAHAASSASGPRLRCRLTRPSDRCTAAHEYPHFVSYLLLGWWAPVVGCQHTVQLQQYYVLGRRTGGVGVVHEEVTRLLGLG